MPQSALPDVNTKFIIYTREAINGWKSRNYDSAIGSLYAFNGLLPDEEPGKYRVIVDTNEYRNKTKQDLIAICKNCDKEINYNEIRIMNVVSAMIVRIISNVSNVKIWVCPQCNKDNELEETKLIQKILKDPSFITVVPKPPTRKDGIIDRTQFHTKFTVWFWTFLTELEAQAARFRQDYKPQGSGEEEFLDSQDTGELKDI